MHDAQHVRGLGLLSGGLDSQLAICVLKAQGISVEAIVFDSPFYNPAAAKRAVEQLGVPLRVIDFTADIIALVKDPPHGFGKCMNPCIDCHARMLNRAGAVMRAEGFDFLFTGEVLNERPMSQNRRSLEVVARDSQFEGYVLRPLSAQLLPETIPEQEGKVDRTRLLSLSGRSRKPQFALARQYGLREYPTPAGGCRLTEPNYSQRLKELTEHEGLDDLHAVALLRRGRHFRLPSGRRFVVGRDADDNEAIEALAQEDDALIGMVDIPGPSGLLMGGGNRDDIERAAAICARYVRWPPGEPARVHIRAGETEQTVAVHAAESTVGDGMRI